MSNKNFKTIFDCGSSKVRAATFNKHNKNEIFYSESEFFTDQLSLESRIEKIITSFENDTNEYINSIDLMVDSPKMLSIGISVSKKLDGSKLRRSNIQFLLQEAKQQILKYYSNYNIAHIIINNYKIDNVDYSNFPDEIECRFISLDILFICLPSDLLKYFKKVFSSYNILVNQIICSSYAKSINYKSNLDLTSHVSFIDVGFNKVSIISFFNNSVCSFDVLPIGGNHITKDISKILKMDLNQSERLKINLHNSNYKFSNDTNFSLDILENIISARTEEILELCKGSLKLNTSMSDHSKIILMGEGSKIFQNDHKNEFLLSNEVDFFQETTKDICESGFKFETVLNKQEVLVIPKKHTKKGFFEKLFHFFR